MNIAEWSIRNSVITWVLTVLMAVVGVTAFGNLSLLEDPEFTIKDALVFTPYPGATAAEVEEEVSDEIEKAIQELPEVEVLRRSLEPLLLGERIAGVRVRNPALREPVDELGLGWEVAARTGDTSSYRKAKFRQAGMPRSLARMTSKGKVS